MGDDDSFFHRYAGIAEADRFMIARAHAIDCYSRLEQTMCSCLAYFGDMSNKTAGTIFFKINSARAVCDILDSLKKHKVGADYNLFWNSVTKRFSSLAQRRNSIVHWSMAVTVPIEDEDADPATDKEMQVSLMPPNYWSWDEATPELKTNDCIAFGSECEAVMDYTKLFIGRIQSAVQVVSGPWYEIFQQPLAYPIPPGSPLYPTPTGQRPQPPPYAA
jgi:hypothetical protein